VIQELEPVVLKIDQRRNLHANASGVLSPALMVSVHATVASQLAGMYSPYVRIRKDICPRVRLYIGLTRPEPRSSPCSALVTALSYANLEAFQNIGRELGKWPGVFQFTAHGDDGSTSPFLPS
jgi:hypothetical protein